MDLSLESLIVGDEPSAWASAGFVVDHGVVALDGVRIRCAADHAGADRWCLRGGDAPAVPADVDGIATSTTSAPAPPPARHPNGVTHLDHVVLRSPDLDRTTDALASLGIDLRRVREVPRGEEAFQQRFFRLGEAILELVGPAAPTGDTPCTIWGYALVTPDIDASAAALGDRCSPPKPAVQPGRRIATVRTRELGIGVTLALMTPHVRPSR